jgi:hypothetical protein
MASAGARAYLMGVWGLCPQWGPGAKPLVRGPGGLRPPEAENFCTTYRQKLCLKMTLFSVKVNTFTLVAKEERLGIGIPN